MRNGPSFAIIGAGFSGSLLAVHLARRLPRGGRIHLIEQRPGFGGGSSAGGQAGHLLNVRAGRMSAFENDPDHFLRWLLAQPEGRGAHAGSFVAPGLYGRYMRSLLAEQLRGRSGLPGINLVPDEAAALEVAEDGVIIHTAGGRPLHADMAVLAVGHFPPELPRGLAVAGLPVQAGEAGRRGRPGFIADPWDDLTLGRIRATDPLLVIGTGLTMVDLVLGLAGRGHRGGILALSRRGLLPHRDGGAVAPLPWDEPPQPQLSGLLHQLRRRVRILTAGGGDPAAVWQGVVDGLRPHLQSWWRGWDQERRRRFLRHLRPWWDIHRHRMPPASAEALERLRAEGRLRLAAGRILEMEENGEGLRVVWQPRGGGLREIAMVRFAVNCAEPSRDFTLIKAPLIRRLLEGGVIAPDPLRLGLTVDDSLRLVDRQGRPHRRLFALGPPTRGRFWEVTAVPEIRRQAEGLADYLLSAADAG